MIKMKDFIMLFYVQIRPHKKNTFIWLPEYVSAFAHIVLTGSLTHVHKDCLSAVCSLKHSAWCTKETEELCLV